MWPVVVENAVTRLYSCIARRENVSFGCTRVSSGVAVAVVRANGKLVNSRESRAKPVSAERVLCCQNRLTLEARRMFQSSSVYGYRRSALFL